VETWDAIRSRRNVRSFEDRQVPGEHLERILEAGRRAPSSRNWQPWDFVVVSRKQDLEALTKVWRGAWHAAGSAVVVALVGPDVDDQWNRDRLQYDLGQVTMSMLLAAADLGIGGCHAAVTDQELARRILGFPGDRFCAYLVSFGYPADRPLQPIRRPDRRPYDDVVHVDRW
jgi:nitroreductase